MATILANLALARGRLKHGLNTAQAIGDNDWCKARQPYLDCLNNRISVLLKVLSPEVVVLARQITNAPI